MLYMYEVVKELKKNMVGIQSKNDHLIVKI